MFSGGRSRVALAALSIALVGAMIGAVPAGASSGTVVVKEAKRVCARPRPGKAACDAMKVVLKRVSRNSVEAHAAPALSPATINSGPAGGYSPAQVAKAYNVDVNASASSNQTVTIIDAFNDPNVLSDLNTFDSHYGLPAETNGTSFKVVNQTGTTSPLPSNDSGWAEEISLDVDTVRGLCHKCKILLVEATTNSFVNLATAVNEAATLGATEISNSYGGPESGSSTAAAYDHPGIPITASTGDDGWYDWDFINLNETVPSEPNSPASYRSVVGVGGTSLYLNPDGSRAGETVWNNNGPGDIDGFNLSNNMGASGGGCSFLYAAKPWQQNATGYSSLGCSSNFRSVTDIAAVADPYTGYDIFDSFSEPGWMTLGGTSLAAPSIATLFALAGGGHGVAYPTLTLYGHLKSDTSSHVNDIKLGGTGLCSTMSTTQCFGFNGGNPNTFGFGLVDCGFDGVNNNAGSILTNLSHCDAQPGFDCVSGIGTPNGLTVFSAIGPHPVISNPGTVTHNVLKAFTSSSSTDPFPGGTITSRSWNWGDGHTSTGTAPSHTYTSTGSKTITLTITDSYGVSAHTTRTITVV